MVMREYSPSDQEGCIEVFKSNCPTYFHPCELEPFIFWLNQQEKKVPAYANSKRDYYYVVEENNRIIGCGGFYLVKEQNTAQFSWGMIHSKYHKKGYGKAFYEYREEEIKQISPSLKIALGTSQYSYKFFEKMGLKVINMIPQGYAENIDRYDMEKK
jgi:[ribosomal protein S18]-alanine N-acetyltransferase